MTNKLADIPAFSVPVTKVAPPQSAAARERQLARISEQLKKRRAVLIAHYYTDADVQALADYSGGFVGDSLAMARFGAESDAELLMVAGVRFMGESAKIISPEKTVLMPDLAATCSLDLGCPADIFTNFCARYPDRTRVVYANTSAAVKAQSDWVVTSSNAIKIVEHLHERGEKILWAPDRFLGSYIQQQTGADMVLWQGACIVHEEYQHESLKDLKAQYTDAAVLVHPESPAAVVALADVVGSTSVLIEASRCLPNRRFIVATDRGIFYKMRQASPDKEFIEAPTAGHGATCRSCGHCPWMAMNTLDSLEKRLLEATSPIELSPEIIAKARLPLQRMLDFGC